MKHPENEVANQGFLDSRTRTSTRFDCPVFAKIRSKFKTRTINLSLCWQYRLLSYSYCW